MFLQKLISKQLRTDEQVKIVLHQFPLAYWKSSLVITSLILAPAAVFFQLLQRGKPGILMISIAWIVAGLWFLRSWLVWSLNTMVITNQRLIDIDQRGIWSREISEAPLEVIQDIRTAQKGPSAHLFDYGTIKVQTASHDEHFELTHVRHPIQMQELLFSIRQEQLKPTEYGTQDQKASLI